MSRSTSGGCLHNWAFEMAMWRKLHLEVMTPTADKTMASNYIRDGWARTLQPALVTPGYIRPSAKVKTEKPGLCKCTPNARPLDVTFDPDPDSNPLARCTGITTQ